MILRAADYFKKRKIYIVLNIGQYIPKYRTDKMNIITEQYSIDAAFLNRPWSKLTYKEIQKLSGKRSRSYIYGVLNRLIKEDIIITESIGKSIIYGTNLNSLKVQNYLGFLEQYKAWQSKYIPPNIILRIGNKLIKITPFFTFIITGSYAKQLQTKKSDLDVVIICDDSIDPKKIYAELKYESDMSVPKVHLYVFRKREFLAMLLDEKENYGKEIARYHLIFAGGTAYYAILQEAIKYGFKG